MRIRRASLVALLLASFALGALIGRRWKGEYADLALSVVALAAIALGLVLLARYLWPPRSRLLTAAQPETPDAQGEAQNLVLRQEIAPREPRRWVLHLRDWRGGSFEVALTLAPDWREVFGFDATRPDQRRGSLSAPARAEALAWGMFAFSLGVYALTRLWQLDQFPIYFFSDEAVHPVLASDLIRRGFHDAEGVVFPIFFKNGTYWNLSLSVYIHALTVAAFGKTVWVTRATSALLTLFGAAAVGLILKWIFRVRWWWLVVLFLTVTPAWFLHSRTAFEVAIMISFYAWFLLCYLLYRERSPNYLFPALVFGAAAFYTYAAGQVVIVATGVLFLFSDWRYHLRYWKNSLMGIGWIMLLAVPYLHFRMQMPDTFEAQLRALDSYWFKPLSLEDKLQRFVVAYAGGLDPRYWFQPNGPDLVRHQMKGYGNLSLFVSPFLLAGLLVCLRQFRSPSHRAILLAALGAPFGGALVAATITRVLVFVIPANILVALGFNAIVERIRSPRWRRSAVAASVVVLSSIAVYMLRDALVNGPTWYENYGLYGMQWGAEQVVGKAIPDYLASHPGEHLYLSSTWANGTDLFLRFFPVDRTRVVMRDVNEFISSKQEIDPHAVFVMPKEALDGAVASGKFKPPQIDKTVEYPNGTDGFYFARLEYADNSDQVFEAEAQKRRELVVEKTVLNGEEVQITHSPFDIGRVQDLFDGEPFTLARGAEANPLIVELQFGKPRNIRALTATFGQMDFTLTSLLYGEGSDTPVRYFETYRGLPGEPHVEMAFDQGPALVNRIRFEVEQIGAQTPAHIHVRELVLH